MEEGRVWELFQNCCGDAVDDTKGCRLICQAAIRKVRGMLKDPAIEARETAELEWIAALLAMSDRQKLGGFSGTIRVGEVQIHESEPHRTRQMANDRMALHPEWFRNDQFAVRMV